MYCLNCGMARLADATYCHACGSRLDPSRQPASRIRPRIDSKARPVPWRGGQVALGVVLVAVSLIPVTGIAVGVGLAVEPNGTAAAAWVSVHLMALAIVAVVWRLGAYRTAAPLSVLGLALKELTSGKTVLLAAAVLGASIGLTVVYAWLVGALDSDILELPETTADIAFPGPGVLFTFQALAIVTPITEELFFRGFVLTGLVPRWGAVGAVVCSALVFSLFHLSVATLIPVFMTGLLLGWLYHRTGSLWPGILAHAGQNALVLAITVYWVSTNSDM